MPHFSEEETISIIKRLIELAEIKEGRLKSKELATSPNNRYATALEVLNEYEEDDSYSPNEPPFEIWLKLRLNADGTSHS